MAFSQKESHWQPTDCQQQPCLQNHGGRRRRSICCPTHIYTVNSTELWYVVKHPYYCKTWCIQSGKRAHHSDAVVCSTQRWEREPAPGNTKDGACKRDGEMRSTEESRLQQTINPIRRLLILGEDNTREEWWCHLFHFFILQHLMMVSSFHPSLRRPDMLIQQTDWCPWIEIPLAEVNFNFAIIHLIFEGQG